MTSDAICGLCKFKNLLNLNFNKIMMMNDDDGLCLSYFRILSPKLNLGWRSFFSLSRYVDEFIQIIPFFKRSSFNKLKCETVIGIVLCYCHQAYCLLYIWAKLTVAFTCTSLPSNFNSSVIGCGCGFGFEQNFGGSTDLARKRHRSADLDTSIHPLQ